MRSVLSLLTLALCLLGLQCGTDTIAGGTTDSGNSRVAAQVYDTGGNPVANAAVRLRASDYVTPPPSLKKSGASAADAVTDPNGRFTIEGIDKGTYRIEVNGNGAALLLSCELDGVGARDFGADTVRPYATISGSVQLSGTTASPRFVQVAGLERLAAIDAAGRYSIPDLPAGTYTLRIVSADSSSAPVVMDSIAAESGETTTAPLAGWRFAQRIFLNTTPSGADVSEDVVAFPLVVGLNAANFDFSSARDSGRDIRFTKPDGTPLPCEIEQWDAAAQSAVVWVRIDTVRGNDSTRYIVMHYGNSTAPSASSDDAVFDTAGGFAGVWHMSDHATEDQLDATPGAHHGTPVGYEGDESVPGIVGRANHFTGTNYLDAGDIDIDESFTLSTWVRPDTITGWQYLVSKVSDTFDHFVYCLRMSDDPTGVVGMHAGSAAGAADGTSTKTILRAETWYHIAGVCTGDSLLIYCNGALELGRPVQFTMGPLEQNDRPVFIGFSQYPYGDNYFTGSLDEVRIESRARMAAWIRLLYENQRPDQRLVEVR